MSQPSPDKPPFEHALAELERLVRELEDGQVGLEESLARYERGIGLLKHCYGLLQHAEQRILEPREEPLSTVAPQYRGHSVSHRALVGGIAGDEVLHVHPAAEADPAEGHWPSGPRDQVPAADPQPYVVVGHGLGCWAASAAAVKGAIPV